MKGQWFYTDNFMEDGVTRISLFAQNQTQIEAFRRNGWRPVENSRDGNVCKLASDKKKEKPMKERKAVENVVARIYKDSLKKTGKLPDGAQVREMETKVKQAAENADRHKRRR